MPARAKKFHENQRLGRIPPIRACRAAPGFSERRSPNRPIWLARPRPRSRPRLSSARANNSASFGSFPAVEQHQPVQHAGDRGAPRRKGLALARPAGDLQIGLVEALEEAEAGRATVGAASRRSSVTWPNLLSMTPAASSSPSSRCGAHSRGDVGHGGPDAAQFGAGTIDFELGDRPSCRATPAEDVLAAAFGMPEDLVRLCFVGRIDLADGKCRLRARGHAPARLGAAGSASAISGNWSHRWTPTMASSASVPT